MSIADKLRGRMPKPVLWQPEPRILLCPNVPKPLHGVAPRGVLGAKWWDATRQAAYRSTAYHCLACGVWKGDARGRKWLEGHELYYVDYELGRSVYVCAVPLCHFCHSYIHDGRLQALLDTGKIHQAKYVAIMQHGDSVLQRAGLRRLTHAQRDAALLKIPGGLAPWSSWRLVVDGKEYRPKFKTFDEWRKAFGV